VGQEHAIPTTPTKPITKPGDLWILGSHRLLCGDSTKEENVRRLFKNARAGCVFTDPPYGVSYEDRGGKFGMIKNDDLRDDSLVKLLQPALRLAVKYAADNAGFYIWHASSTRDDFSYAMKAAGLMERQYLIWAKNGFSFGWADYKWSHEPCFYASKADKKPEFYGDMGQSTIWRVSCVLKGSVATTLGSGIVLTDGNGQKLWIQGTPPQTKKIRTTRLGPGDKIAIASADAAGTVWEVSRETDMVHPTQKPTELAIRAIRNSSKEGEVVYDPFLGSGTTLMGADYTGRRCYGCELDPKYADTIVKRWEDFSAKKAVLEKV
jgi:DNA modification methylase